LTRKVLNTYHVSYPDLNQLGAGLLSVLVQDDVTRGFYVYTAIVRLPDVSSRNYETARKEAAEHVALRGNAEHYERAVTFYPGIEKKSYAG